MRENHAPEFAFRFPILEPRSPSRRRQRAAHLLANRAIRSDVMRTAQDGPQRSDVAGARLLVSQLGLETVIDLAGVMEPDKEAKPGGVNIRQRPAGQCGEALADRRQAQQSRGNSGNIDRVVDETEPARATRAASVRGFCPSHYRASVRSVFITVHDL